VVYEWILQTKILSMVFQMYGENLNQFIHTFIFKNLKKIKLIFYEFMIYKKLF